MHISQYGVYWTCGVFILLVVSVMGSYIIKKKIKFVHDSGLAVLFGLILSVILKYGFDKSIEFQLEGFLYMFLPPVVFAESFSIKKNKFFKNWCSQLLYGVVGTIITFILFVLANYNINKYDFVSVVYTHDGEVEDIDLEFSEIMVMSSILAAKDSFAAASMIDHHHLANLHSVVFGEGLMNDATALSLFQVLEEYFLHSSHEDEHQIINEDGENNYHHNSIYILADSDSENEETETWVIICEVFVQFCYQFLIAAIAGVIIGIIASYLMNKFVFLNETPIYELIFLYGSGMFSFSLIEAFELPGVLSLIITGFILGHYGWYNLSEKSKITAGTTVQFVGQSILVVMFVLVGISFFEEVDNISYGLIWVNFVLTILIRFIVTGCMCLLSKLIQGKKHNIKFKSFFLLTYSGIPRGVLAVALISSISPDEFSHPYILKTTVKYTVVITTVIFGNLTPLVQKFLFRHDEEKGHDFNDDDEKDLLRKLKHFERLQAEREGNFSEEIFPSKFSRTMKMINYNYIKPILIRDYKEKVFEYQADKKLFKEDQFELQSKNIGETARKQQQSIMMLRKMTMQIENTSNFTDLENLKISQESSSQGSSNEERDKMDIDIQTDKSINDIAQQKSVEFTDINQNNDSQLKTILLEAPQINQQQNNDVVQRNQSVSVMENQEQLQQVEKQKKLLKKRNLKRLKEMEEEDKQMNFGYQIQRMKTIQIKNQMKELELLRTTTQMYNQKLNNLKSIQKDDKNKNNFTQSSIFQNKSNQGIELFKIDSIQDHNQNKNKNIIKESNNSKENK